MQIGDLVELSSAGRKRKHNTEVLRLWGMIMEIKGTYHPYRIDWFYPCGTTTRVPMARYEIKKMRGDK